MIADLAIVAADKSMAESMRAILSRPDAIGMRAIAPPTIVEHPNRDPGVWKTGHELLSVYANDHEHGLIMLDHAWHGNPHALPTALAEEIEGRCRAAWGDRARCIVISPELEAWVWSTSPHVARVLKWESDAALRDWLTSQDLLGEGCGKPEDPKAAPRAALREKRVPPSAAQFRKLAQRVSFDSCEDAAFNRLLDVLRTWFPASG